MSAGQRLIEVEGVTFRYGSAEDGLPPALADVSFAIGPGEFVGIVGQNGSGKTTLARHFNALLKPVTGRVLVEGRDTRDVEPGHLAGTVGYVFQNPDHALFLPSVREELAYSLKFQGLTPDERSERIDSALAAFGLTALADQHPASFGRGARRLVVLAAAFAMDPLLLVLDEPTGGLDHHLTTNLMATLAGFVQRGRSVVIISHNMQLVANNCRRVLALSDGRVVADAPPSEFFNDDAMLSAAGLERPDLAALGNALRDTGVTPGTVALDPLVEQVATLIDRRGARENL